MPVVFDASSKKKVKHQDRFSGKKNLGFQEQHHLKMPESIAAEKPAKGNLSAYMVNPKELHFETQDREEKIFLLLRRHVVTNLRWILTALLFMVVPVFSPLFPVFGFLPMRFQLLFLVLWYLLITAYVFEHFLSWYYNVYIITDERIVDVDFHSLMYKEVAQAKIDNIQDVTFVMGGLSSSWFNYGTVFIQTAGEQREFDFDDVPHPNRVAKILNELIIEEEQEKIEGRVR